VGTEHVLFVGERDIRPGSAPRKELLSRVRRRKQAGTSGVRQDGEEEEETGGAVSEKKEIGVRDVGLTGSEVDMEEEEESPKVPRLKRTVRALRLKK